MKKISLIGFIFLLFFINNHAYSKNVCDESKSIGFLNDQAKKFFAEEKFKETFLCSQAAANKDDPFAIGNMGWHYERWKP